MFTLGDDPRVAVSSFFHLEVAFCIRTFYGRRKFSYQMKGLQEHMAKHLQAPRGNNLCVKFFFDGTDSASQQNQ